SYDSPVVVRQRFIPIRSGLAEDLLRANRHEPKGIRAMAGPIVVRSKPDVAHVVLLLVVPAQSVQTRLGSGFVEPDGRKDAPACFDARLGSAFALIRYDLDFVAGRFQRRRIRDIEHLVVGLPVMREPDLS